MIDSGKITEGVVVALGVLLNHIVVVVEEEEATLLKIEVSHHKIEATMEEVEEVEEDIDRMIFEEVMIDELHLLEALVSFINRSTRK